MKHDWTDWIIILGGCSMALLVVAATLLVLPLKHGAKCRIWTPMVVGKSITLMCYDWEKTGEVK